MANSESSPTNHDNAADPSQEHAAAFDFTDPNSPLASLFFQAGHVAAAILLSLIFVFYSLFVRLHHTDVWMHVKYGEAIVKNGALPKTEMFCAYSDKPVDHFQWLTQSTYYLVFRAGRTFAGGSDDRQLAGGVELLRTFHALVTTLRFWILLLAFRRLTGSLPFACAGVGILLVLTFGSSAIQRPQSFGEFFFAVLLFALSGSLLRKTAVVGLPVLYGLWVNSHGSFVIGLLMLAVFAVGRGADVVRNSKNGFWRQLLRDMQLRRIVIVLVASAAVCAFLNPYGSGIFARVGQLARNPNIATLQEWQPLNFSDAAGGHWAYLAILIALVISQLISPKLLGPTQILLIGTFGIFPLLQQRMMIWWVMAAIWILLPLWRATQQRLPEKWITFESVPSFRKTLLAGAFVILALVWSGPVGWLVSGRPTPLAAALSPETPWRIARQLQLSGKDGRRQGADPLGTFIARNFPEGFRGGIFASDTLGDYLEWALPQDKMRVMVYTHAHLFPKDFWQDYMTVQFGRAGWSHVLDRYGINLIVVERNREHHQELIRKVTKHPQWRIIEPAGRQSMVFFVAARKKPL